MPSLLNKNTYTAEEQAVLKCKNNFRKTTSFMSKAKHLKFSGESPNHKGAMYMYNLGDYGKRV